MFIYPMYRIMMMFPLVPQRSPRGGTVPGTKDVAPAQDAVLYLPSVARVASCVVNPHWHSSTPSRRR